KDTHFPLRGKHDGLVCEACHKVAGKKRALRMECVACHMDDDSHNEQQGDQCQRCHNEQGWSVDVLFDHDLGGFPLIGQHSALACESCHISGRFKDAEKATSLHP
ncbi:cytochrome C, partial [Candidatus Endoriftia persephone str. Guaymas]|nr:cytochrome C [Candidatus Endoriftia persephone str. Guaymas]